MGVPGPPAGVSLGDVQRNWPSALMDGPVCTPESTFLGKGLPVPRAAPDTTENGTFGFRLLSASRGSSDTVAATKPRLPECLLAAVRQMPCCLVSASACGLSLLLECKLPEGRRCRHCAWHTMDAPCVFTVGQKGRGFFFPRFLNSGISEELLPLTKLLLLELTAGFLSPSSVPSKSKALCQLSLSCTLSSLTFCT